MHRDHETNQKTLHAQPVQASEAQRVGYDVASSVFRSQDRQSWPSAYIFQAPPSSAARHLTGLVHLTAEEQALLDSFRDVNIFESPDEPGALPT